MESLRPIVIDQHRGKLPVRAHLHRAEAEIVLTLGLNRLVENHLVITARDWLAVPGPVLRAGRECPPVKEVAVLDRDRAVVLLYAAFHLLEQLVHQWLVLCRPGAEIIVLGVKVGEDVRVIHLGIFRVA